MFQMYDVVKLAKDLPEKGLTRGAKGTVLIVYDEPPLPRAYEVEFFNDLGETLAVTTVEEEDIEAR